MITINVIGGLGNQMFQYAFGYAIAREKGTDLKLDISGFEKYSLRSYGLDFFSISPIFLAEKDVEEYTTKPSSVLGKLFFQKKKRNSHFYQEPHFHYDENVFSAQNNTYFQGYWQSEKYFFKYRGELLSQFQLKNPLTLLASKYLELIRSTISVSLHIRRGDYVSNNKTNAFHGVCDLDYYKSAVSLILDSQPSTTFFVFSDDIDWCKQHFAFLDNPHYVELEESAPDCEEMYLMSQCKHNIIANSSFSWWGAWLNQNPDKIVVAPKKWFADPSINTSDLIPESWIRL